MNIVWNTFVKSSMRYKLGAIVHFYFLITYGVCEKRNYYNRISEKKILSFP